MPLIVRTLTPARSASVSCVKPLAARCRFSKTLNGETMDVLVGVEAVVWVAIWFAVEFVAVTVCSMRLPLSRMRPLFEYSAAQERILSIPMP
jgi:hypothetical protein